MTGQAATNFPGETGPGSKLTDAQVGLARERWGQGMSLGEIARELGCSIYDLSPWLYQDSMRDAMRQLGLLDDV